MQTDNLELKKLVYLYLMNYAKSQPDMAIMAVNTFVKVRRSWVGLGGCSPRRLPGCGTAALGRNTEAPFHPSDSPPGGSSSSGGLPLSPENEMP